MQRSTLAWFRGAALDAAEPRSDTAALVAALRSSYDIDVVTATEAHDFVWKHFRRPYDVCVYELSDAADAQFMRAYLVHYPGVLRVQDLASAVSRLIHASRLVMTPHASSARTLSDMYAGMPVRSAPIGIDPPVHVDDDVVVAVEWPPTSRSVTRALEGMAAGKPVVVFDCDATADWPALNPQTWQPRSSVQGAPIAVSIDPRDERHSLMLAMKRLRADRALREELGAAARAWWASHATIEHAVTAWKAVLQEAMTLPAPTVSATDGTESARAILEQFGVAPDIAALRGVAYSAVRNSSSSQA